MMIGFFEDKMTLNMTLIECDPMLVSNALVSCVTSLEEKLWFVTNFNSYQYDFFQQGQLMLLH